MGFVYIGVCPFWADMQVSWRYHSLDAILLIMHSILGLHCPIFTSSSIQSLRDRGTRETAKAAYTYT